MSRAKPAAERVALDAYQTPAVCAEAICATLARLLDEPSRIVEPSAGAGAFVRAARAAWPLADVNAVEVDPEREADLLAAGATTVEIGRWEESAARRAEKRGPFEMLILGNPPYRAAAEHIEAALALLKPGEHLAFLLRLNFLGAAKRVGCWKRWPLWAVIPVTPRPSFIGGGNDATEYGVFVWRKGYAGAPRILPPIVWREKKGRRAP